MGKREAKQAVAMALMNAAGDLIEFWYEKFDATNEEPPCSAPEAAEMMAGWLKGLPGSDWDERLPKVWEK